MFIIIIAAALVAILSAIGTFLPHQFMMSGMQGMMGTGRPEGSPQGVLWMYFWPSMLTISAFAMVIVVSYLVAFPNIRYVEAADTRKLNRTSSPPIEPQLKPPANSYNSLDIVMRVMKPDERAAMEVLKNSGGTCLQKDITFKAGLSKLRTHRVVARLAERGIIQVRKIGKTNEITLPSWLSGSSDRVTRESNQ